jgi:hypothetical protein
MEQKIINKAKKMLANADTGTNNCKNYNNGFMDGVKYAIKALLQPHVMHSFSMQTVLEFGKHKGKSIQRLFDEDEESYIMWMFKNIDGKWSSEIEKELEWRQNNIKTKIKNNEQMDGKS